MNEWDMIPGMNLNEGMVRERILTMILDFNKVTKLATKINPKHVKAIKVVARQRIFRMVHLDDRTTGFDNIKPFAADQDNYYVCCPCCLQIEQIKASDFGNGSRLKVQCKSTKNSQRFTISQDGSSVFGIKMTGYSVDLTDWEK